jgi:hypothetical protein
MLTVRTIFKQSMGIMHFFSEHKEMYLASIFSSICSQSVVTKCCADSEVLDHLLFDINIVLGINLAVEEVLMIVYFRSHLSILK